MKGQFVLFVFAAASAVAIGDDSVLRDTGDSIVKFFEWFGNLGMFCGRLVRSALTPPYEVREFVQEKSGKKYTPPVPSDSY
jgi:hypothetical protein